MYVYIYDNWLRAKKFASTVKAMEIRLTDFGIAGKIVRLQNYTDAKALIDDEVRRGAKTIVVVGNDKTFGQILSGAATAGCIFGFLPVGGDNTIAEVLGIPIGADACTVLSRRRIEKLDIGWVNNRYFVSQLKAGPGQLEVFYDERFRVTGQNLLEVVVCNLQPWFWKRNSQDRNFEVVHPQDGKLEAWLRPLTRKRFWGYSYEDPSIFPFSEMEIKSQEPFTVEADGKITKEIRIKIKLAPERVNMIVGRDRKF
ncbi:MAG: diacylglycerol kinase family protein [Candidatus Magasanikbacteria bacterium]|nr:diacylglycerol kinase family protein [Candidatus Magasanikbacteria bacterium]